MDSRCLVVKNTFLTVEEERKGGDESQLSRSKSDSCLSSSSSRKHSSSGSETAPGTPRLATRLLAGVAERSQLTVPNTKLARAKMYDRGEDEETGPWPHHNSFNASGAQSSGSQADARTGTEKPSAELFCNIGSQSHHLGQCSPCAWFAKPNGCRTGNECPYCHVCPPVTWKQRRTALKQLAEEREAESSKLPPPASQSCQLGQCSPCAWFHKPEGCRNGTQCIHCHVCPPVTWKQRRIIHRKFAEEEEAAKLSQIPSDVLGPSPPRPPGQFSLSGQLGSKFSL